MEKPILFNTEMVRAIMDGRKTQTRRVVKPQPFDVVGCDDCSIHSIDNDCLEFNISYPYNPGDILWVKETFYGAPGGKENQDVCYKTLCPCGLPDKEHEKVRGWKPSIHMPRKAARLFLKVKSVRVERLQEITLGDVGAEGIQASETDWRSIQSDEVAPPFCWFARLWDSIYSKRGYGWDTNPWVWMIEFKKH